MNKRNDNRYDKFIIDSFSEENKTPDFRRFYDYYYEKVYRIVHYFISSEEDCEEVISDIFYLIWNNWLKLNEIKSLDSYLFVICRNESYHYYAKNNPGQMIPISRLTAEISISQDSIEQKLEEQELAKVYIDALNTLPKRCKLIFLMVREENLSHQKVADILEISKGTVERQMNIAIKKLGKYILKHLPSLKADLPTCEKVL